MLVEGDFREKRGRRERGREEEKLQERGKGSRWLFPRGLRRCSCCGRRGLSRGAVRLSIAALVVEFRPSARSVKVVKAPALDAGTIRSTEQDGTVLRWNSVAHGRGEGAAVCRTQLDIYTAKGNNRNRNGA